MFCQNDYCRIVVLEPSFLAGVEEQEQFPVETTSSPPPFNHLISGEHTPLIAQGRTSWPFECHIRVAQTLALTFPNGLNLVSAIISCMAWQDLNSLNLPLLYRWIREKSTYPSGVF